MHTLYTRVAITNHRTNQSNIKFRNNMKQLIKRVSCDPLKIIPLSERFEEKI